MNSYIKSILPAWPVVPARLWLTLAGVGLAMLSLVFRAELWATTPHAESWNWSVLLLMLLASWLQTLPVVWGVSLTYTGPWWMRLLLMLVAVSFVGFSILLLLLCLFLLL